MPDSKQDVSQTETDRAASAEEETLPSYVTSEREHAGQYPPNYNTAQHPSAGRSTDGKKRPDPALRWGVTPSGPGPSTTRDQEPPPDHPVHKMSKDEQDKLRKKGINPVLKAEMDAAAAANTSKLGRFMAKRGLGSNVIGFGAGVGGAGGGG